MGYPTDPGDVAIFTPKDLEEGLTVELVNEICTLVSNGNHLNVAAGYLGVDPDLIYKWCSLGKQGKVGYKEFYLRVQQAQAEHETRLVDLWQNHFEKDYRSIRDFLTRRYPNRWSEKHTVEHTGEGGGPIKVDVSSLSEDDLENMRNVVKKLGEKL